MAQVFGVGIDELQKTLGNNRYFYGLRRTSDGTIYMVKADLLELEDGVELNRSFHRHLLHPGTVAAGSTALTVTDVSGEDAGVQAIFNAVMTDEVKEAYRLHSVGIRSMN